MASPLDGYTLLVADDEPDLRRILAESLERLGARVLQASNGVQALELYKQGGIDALLTDIRMPGGDGIQLLQAIKNSPGPLPKRFVCTGFADSTADFERDLGVEAVFHKPFPLGETMRQIVALTTQGRS